MSEPVEAAVSETETGENDDQAKPEPKPTETVDFWKSKAREQEKRAKENAAAAKELADLKAARLSDEERKIKAQTDLERERDQARAEALRWRIAAKHGISDDDAELFLTGTDEDTLVRQAERLNEREVKPGKGTHVPGVGDKPAQPPNLDEQIRAAEAEGDFKTATALKTHKLMALAKHVR